uniref:Uncharacterized protein n=1 Tax=Avena sativa TaxID=4498 RepID=A0ACD5T7A5_AVESA
MDLDESVLYNTSGGMPHGRLSIATGAVKKAHIISAARATNLKPSSSVAYRNVIQENQQLRHTNEILTRKTEMHDQMFRMIFAEMGRDLPEWFQQGQTQAHTQGNTRLEDSAMDDLVDHGNTGRSNDGENIGGDSYNQDGDSNYASGGGSDWCTCTSTTY